MKKISVPAHMKIHGFKASSLQSELRSHRLSDSHCSLHGCRLVFMNNNTVIRHFGCIKLAANAPFLMPDVHSLI
ncbi:MAG: hypothetical protein ACLRYR_09215 [Bifidobacterium dentium]